MTSSVEAGVGVGPQAMKGWPYTDFATGWYQIGYSDDIKAGDVKPAHWLDQDLVIFRTESGELSVLDAYCPHMGAHLGHVGRHGGGVCGETLQCPWHGWQWTTDGSNASIPYMPGETLPVRAEAKHVREIDGCVIMWYDHAGEPPTYEWAGLPYMTDASDYYPINHNFDGPHLAKPQFPFENAADPHHFIYVHGSGLDAEFSDFEVEGPVCRNTMRLMFGAGRERTWLTPNGPVMGEVDAIHWGASMGIARFRIEDMVVIHMTNITPVDKDNTMFFSTVTANKEPGVDEGDTSGRHYRMMMDQHTQIRNDFHIWQNMRYRVKPLFTGEAEKTRYRFIRHHFDQFYPNPVYRENQREDA